MAVSLLEFLFDVVWCVGEAALEASGDSNDGDGARLEAKQGERAWEREQDGGHGTARTTKKDPAQPNP